MYKIGIDIGTSVTKIILCDENLKIIKKKIIKEKDIEKIIKSFILEGLDIETVNLIGITGVGSLCINEPIYNIQTKKKDEFIASAEGASFISKKNNILVVSIGTGTSFVRKNYKDIKHIGGTGIGGGTLEELCNIFAETSSFEDIKELAKLGDLNNIDLKIKDITTSKISNLNLDTTVSNFGNKNESTDKEDLVLATVNMIIETIGVMSAFILKNDNTKDVIVTGTITSFDEIKKVFDKIEKLHDINFIIPENSEYITALGTLL